MAAQLAQIISFLLTILIFAIVGRSLLSWFDPGVRWPISRVLFDVTEPLVAPIRRVVPPIGMLDLSSLIGLIVLYVLRAMLERALSG